MKLQIIRMQQQKQQAKLADRTKAIFVVRSLEPNKT
jgi:hypothetical protein